jgi:hypothetical protein
VYKIIFDDKFVYFHQQMETCSEINMCGMMFRLIAKALGVDKISTENCYFKFDLPGSNAKLLELLLDITGCKF